MRLMCGLLTVPAQVTAVSWLNSGQSLIVSRSPSPRGPSHPAIPNACLLAVAAVRRRHRHDARALGGDGLARRADGARDECLRALATSGCAFQPEDCDVQCWWASVQRLRTDELRAALASMPTGKTGRSVAVEHLLHLPSDYLEPWLLVTDMIFAGDAPDVVKLGTMNALAKDLERFRP